MHLVLATQEGRKFVSKFSMVFNEAAFIVFNVAKRPRETGEGIKQEQKPDGSMLRNSKRKHALDA